MQVRKVIAFLTGGQWSLMDGETKALICLSQPVKRAKTLVNLLNEKGWSLTNKASIRPEFAAMLKR